MAPVTGVSTASVFTEHQNNNDFELQNLDESSKSSNSKRNSLSNWKRFSLHKKDKTVTDESQSKRTSTPSISSTFSRNSVSSMTGGTTDKHVAYFGPEDGKSVQDYLKLDKTFVKSLSEKTGKNTERKIIVLYGNNEEDIEKAKQAASQNSGKTVFVAIDSKGESAAVAGKTSELSGGSKPITIEYFGNRLTNIQEKLQSSGSHDGKFKFLNAVKTWDQNKSTIEASALKRALDGNSSKSSDTSVFLSHAIPAESRGNASPIDNKISVRQDGKKSMLTRTISHNDSNSSQNNHSSHSQKTEKSATLPPNMPGFKEKQGLCATIASTVKEETLNKLEHGGRSVKKIVKILDDKVLNTKNTVESISGNVIVEAKEKFINTVLSGKKKNDFFQNRIFKTQEKDVNNWTRGFDRDAWSRLAKGDKASSNGASRKLVIQFTNTPTIFTNVQDAIKADNGRKGVIQLSLQDGSAYDIGEVVRLFKENKVPNIEFHGVITDKNKDELSQHLTTTIDILKEKVQNETGHKFSINQVHMALHGSDDVTDASKSAINDTLKEILSPQSSNISWNKDLSNPENWQKPDCAEPVVILRTKTDWDSFAKVQDKLKQYHGNAVVIETTNIESGQVTAIGDIGILKGQEDITVISIDHKDQEDKKVKEAFNKDIMPLINKKIEKNELNLAPPSRIGKITKDGTFQAAEEPFAFNGWEHFIPRSQSQSIIVQYNKEDETNKKVLDALVQNNHNAFIVQIDKEKGVFRTLGHVPFPKGLNKSANKSANNSSDPMRSMLDKLDWHFIGSKKQKPDHFKGLRTEPQPSIEEQRQEVYSMIKPLIDEKIQSRKPDHPIVIREAEKGLFSSKAPKFESSFSSEFNQTCLVKLDNSQDAHDALSREMKSMNNNAYSLHLNPENGKITTDNISFSKSTSIKKFHFFNKEIFDQITEFKSKIFDYLDEKSGAIPIKSDGKSPVKNEMTSAKQNNDIVLSAANPLNEETINDQFQAQLQKPAIIIKRGSSDEIKNEVEELLTTQYFGQAVVLTLPHGKEKGGIEGDISLLKDVKDPICHFVGEGQSNSLSYKDGKIYFNDNNIAEDHIHDRVNTIVKQNLPKDLEVKQEFDRNLFDQRVILKNDNSDKTNNKIKEKIEEYQGRVSILDISGDEIKNLKAYGNGSALGILDKSKLEIIRDGAVISTDKNATIEKLTARSWFQRCDLQAHLDRNILEQLSTDEHINAAYNFINAHPDNSNDTVSVIRELIRLGRINEIGEIATKSLSDNETQKLIAYNVVRHHFGDDVLDKFFNEDDLIRDIFELTKQKGFDKNFINERIFSSYSRLDDIKTRIREVKQNGFEEENKKDGNARENLRRHLGMNLLDKLSDDKEFIRAVSDFIKRHPSNQADAAAVARETILPGTDINSFIYYTKQVDALGFNHESVKTLIVSDTVRGNIGNDIFKKIKAENIVETNKVVRDIYDILQKNSPNAKIAIKEMLLDDVTPKILKQRIKDAKEFDFDKNKTTRLLSLNNKTQEFLKRGIIRHHFGPDFLNEIKDDKKLISDIYTLIQINVSDAKFAVTELKAKHADNTTAFNKAIKELKDSGLNPDKMRASLVEDVIRRHLGDNILNKMDKNKEFIQYLYDCIKQNSSAAKFVIKELEAKHKNNDGDFRNAIRSLKNNGLDSNTTKDFVKFGVMERHLGDKNFVEGLKSETDPEEKQNIAHLTRHIYDLMTMDLLSAKFAIQKLGPVDTNITTLKTRLKTVKELGFDDDKVKDLIAPSMINHYLGDDVLKKLGDDAGLKRDVYDLIKMNATATENIIKILASRYENDIVGFRNGITTIKQHGFKSSKTFDLINPPAAPLKKTGQMPILQSSVDDNARSSLRKAKSVADIFDESNKIAAG